MHSRIKSNFWEVAYTISCIQIKNINTKIVHVNFILIVLHWCFLYPWLLVSKQNTGPVMNALIVWTLEDKEIQKYHNQPNGELLDIT